MKKSIKILLVSIIAIVGLSFSIRLFIVGYFFFKVFFPLQPLDQQGIVYKIEEKRPKLYEVRIAGGGDDIWFDISDKVNFLHNGKSISLEEFLNKSYGSEVRVIGTAYTRVPMESSTEYRPKSITLMEPIYLKEEIKKNLNNYSDNVIKLTYPNDWVLTKLSEGNLKFTKSPTNPTVKTWAKWDDVLTLNCGKDISITAQKLKRLIIRDFEAYSIYQQSDGLHNTGEAYSIKNEEGTCLVDLRVSGGRHAGNQIALLILTSLSLE